jgi:hypothetical protein
VNRPFEGEPLVHLSESWIIEVGGRLLPTLNGYRLGFVGAVLRRRDQADAFVAEQGDDLREQYAGDVRVLPAGDPWQLMRRAAGEGLCGFQLFENGEWSHRYMFMVRVEEAGLNLPTVLACVDREQRWTTSLTRAREARLDHAEVLHWERFDILDGVSGSAGQACPFRDWQHGDPFYELCTEDIVVMLADVPLLGDWNSTEGAFAFFTSRDQAEHYHHHHLGDGRNRMLFVGSGAPSDAYEAMGSLRPTAVTDLGVRLAQLAEVSPLAAWCVNPDEHRENCGYGRLALSGHHPVTLNPKSTDKAARMAAVSGVWRLDAGNILVRERAIAEWSGHDTIRWSGGQSLQLLPLDRSFVEEAPPEGLDLEDLSESESEELVGHYLGGNTLAKSWSHLENIAEAAPTLDSFYIVCWDSITGDGADFPLRFARVLDALRHLWAFEAEHDRRHRTEGAISCMHVGFAGSGNPEFEELRSARFQLGLRRIALRVLRRGYRPADAADIVGLCNGILRTLHVDYAGYAKDILWASRDEERTEVLDDLDIDEQVWGCWEASAGAHVDPEGKRLVVARIGHPAWDTLLPSVQHFVATALLHLEEQGHAPQLDYAPISLELVKALEAELGAVFGNYRDTLNAAPPAHDADNRDEANLAAFLAKTPGKKLPTLGGMSYFLRPPKEGASEMIFSLHTHLRTLSNVGFLTGDKFLKKDLHRVIHDYRNGGVHDSPITEDACRACLLELLGTPGKPGYIPQVASWRSASA